MVTAVGAAAVVAKNVRLFIVTSLGMFFRTSTGLYSNSGTVVRMLGTVARTELAEEPLPACYVADDTLATLNWATDFQNLLDVFKVVFFILVLHCLLRFGFRLAQPPNRVAE